MEGWLVVGAIALVVVWALGRDKKRRAAGGDAASPRSYRLSFSGWVLLLLIGLAGSLALTKREQTTSNFSAPSGQPVANTSRKCGSDMEAFVMSQEFIKRRLKAPSSATFPYFTDNGVLVGPFGECQFAVRAYVDAQNSFGAKLRVPYAMRMIYDPATKLWSASNIVMQEN